MSRTQSSLGVPQYYGPRETNEGLPSTVLDDGVEKTIELRFDYTDANDGLPVLNAAVDAAVNTLKANSLIVAAYLHVETAFTSAGSATLELGVQNASTGAAIDAAGLDSIAVASLTLNSWHVLNGALVGASIGSAAGQISVDDAVAVFTAGVGRLIVKVIEPTNA